MMDRLLKTIMETLLSTIARCENCSKSQPFHYCTDCQDAIETVDTTLTSIVEKIHFKQVLVQRLVLSPMKSIIPANAVKIPEPNAEAQFEVWKKEMEKKWDEDE